MVIKMKDLNGDDVRALKSMLERIEGKIIAAEKMYDAMYFAYWLIAMVGYYLLMPFFQGYLLMLSAVYWPIAVVLSFTVGARTTRMMRNMRESNGGHAINSRVLGFMILASWLLGAFIGWFIIPSLHFGVNDESSLAVGFLSFIGISILGMWLSNEVCKVKSREMIPSFLLAFLGVPVVIGMTTWSMSWAGFLVAMGFSITVFLYLYNAFRNLG